MKGVPGGFSVGICSETWKKRWPVRLFVVCGRISVRSMGPPFHVELPLILILIPCFSAEAVIEFSELGDRRERRIRRVLAGFLNWLPSVSHEEAVSPWRLP